MFLDHHAIGFAAKRFAPQASLGVLFAAPLLLDLIWPVFLFLGWERMRVDPGNTAFTPFAFDYYPYSHSLLAAVAWAIVFSGFCWAVTRYNAGAIVIFLSVISHWLLDVISHRPDMPLCTGERPPAGPRTLEFDCRHNWR
jgi:hypothetical protein